MKTVTRSYKNALEEQLYSTNNFKENINKSSHLYERGMFISLSNYRTTAHRITTYYKDQYNSIVRCLTDAKDNISKDDIRVVKGIPSRELISKLCFNKIPIMVSGIHDYKHEDSWRQYQHQHLYLYNTHHYLPTENRPLIDKINKIDSYLMRYINCGKKWETNKDFVRINPVGVGKYSYTDNIEPTTLYAYLTNAEYGTVIHYISNNKHKPEIQYPLYTTFTTLTNL